MLDALPAQTVGVVFNQVEATSDRQNVVSIPAGTGEAEEHGTIALALKGRYLQYLAGHRSEGTTIDTQEDLVKSLTTEPRSESGADDSD